MPYDCPKCRKTFSSGGHFKRHLRLHEDYSLGNDDTPLPAYKCSVCNARFRHYDALEDHEAESGHRKPYKCHVCDKSFNLEARRNFHAVKVHKVDPPESEASSTNKRSSTIGPSAVQKPEKEREKRHKCPLCDMHFPFTCRLKAHMKQHTGENTFQCPQCSKRFAWQSKLERHLKFHNDDRQFECSLCGHRTKQSFHLSFHLQNAHKLTKEAADALVKETRNPAELIPKEARDEIERAPGGRALKREDDNACDSRAGGNYEFAEELASLPKAERQEDSMDEHL